MGHGGRQKAPDCHMGWSWLQKVLWPMVMLISAGGVITLNGAVSLHSLMCTLAILHGSIPETQITHLLIELMYFTDRWRERCNMSP